MTFKLLICISYGLVIFSFLLLWISRLRNLSLITFNTSLIIAIFSGIIQPIGFAIILVVAILVFLTFQYQKKSIKNISVFILLFIIMLLVYIHILPGFNNICIIKNVYISKDAIPFTLYLNYSSIVITYILVFFAKDINLSNLLDDFLNILKLGIIYGLIAAAILLPISIFLNFIKVDFKFTHYTLIFLFVNLVFACMQEEIFWRGFIQTRITKYTNQIIALITTSLIFASIHILFAGIYFAILAFTASLIYGAAYIKTKKIEVSIICHYIVNLGQFIFFTYPIMKGAL